MHDYLAYDSLHMQIYAVDGYIQYSTSLYDDRVHNYLVFDSLFDFMQYMTILFIYDFT